MEQSEAPELVQKRRPKWPSRTNTAKKSESERSSAQSHPLLPIRSSRTSKIQEAPKSESLLESESALKDFLIIIDPKKHQVSQNLMEYLHMLKKNEFLENGSIIEDISSGIAKLGREGLSESAFQDFKRAAGREIRPETEIFVRTKLFAKIMAISYCDNFNDIGGCFQSLENFSRNKKEEIKVTIETTLRTMEIENIDTNKVKQLTYNIWSLCNSYSQSSQTLCEEDPVKVTIEKSKLPNDETCAAHLQIGTNIHNEPLHIFLWFRNSLFIRKNLDVFSIPLSHFQQTGEYCVKIKLEKRDHKQLVCLFGKHFSNTAAKETRYPEHVISTGELLDSLRNKNVLERSDIRSFQSLARMTDMFLRDVKADIDETDEEGNTLLHHVSCMPLNHRQAENLTWQNRLYARDLNTLSPIQLLIHAGANLVAKNAGGMTPLMYAMKRGESNQENIKELVSYSKPEEINEVDNEDRTVLHNLAKMNTANKVFLTYLTKLLIKRGANPTLEDKKGFNSESTAKYYKNTSVENILQNYYPQEGLLQCQTQTPTYALWAEWCRKPFNILGVILAIFVITAACLLFAYLVFGKKVIEPSTTTITPKTTRNTTKASAFPPKEYAPTTTTNLKTTPNINKNAASHPKDLLYLGNSVTVELPSFSRASRCIVPAYPISGLIEAVTGVVGGEVMVCGGESLPVQSRCYSLVGGVWTKRPSMQKARRGAGGSMTDKGFLVTGGVGGGLHSSVEYFSSGGWVYGPELPLPLQKHCQVSVGRVVIVSGGWSVDMKILASVYKLESGVWTRLPDMKHARMGHSCAALGGQLFVNGGNRGVTSVEIMNISSETWSLGPRLDDMHSNAQAVVYHSVLFLVNNAGLVVKWTDGREWEDVTSIGRIGGRSREVFPAPVVNAGVLGC